MTDADKQTFLATARRVVSIETAALSALGDSLGAEFGEAIELLLSAKGRVIISGMGNSGHIARKIAATFASTGTPAHFVHPAEASHGDLGMMAQGDVALVLSNSGETPELADLVAYTRRFNIPLIGVGGVSDAETAYAKICAGASALQLYTALVFGGISLVREINPGLDALRARDGVANVSEAVGSKRGDWL